MAAGYQSPRAAPVEPKIPAAAAPEGLSVGDLDRVVGHYGVGPGSSSGTRPLFLAVLNFGAFAS